MKTISIIMDIIGNTMNIRTGKSNFPNDQDIAISEIGIPVITIGIQFQNPIWKKTLPQE